MKQKNEFTINMYHNNLTNMYNNRGITLTTLVITIIILLILIRHSCINSAKWGIIRKYKKVSIFN